MTHEQKDYVILFIMLAAAVIIIASFWMHISVPTNHPIESTRRVVLNCTVKSNIDGVITVNDDCKITEVK